MILTETQIATLLEPFLPPGTATPPDLYSQLALYLDLLLRWNARTNLTAIRHPEEIVRRHFGESLFAGALLSSHALESATLLDFGSGAGFPGLPIQLLYSPVRVTLSESQGKKAAFLREVVRVLGLSTEVWASRVETMVATRRFDVVALRAVDNMSEALQSARHRVNAGGTLLALGSKTLASFLPEASATPIPGSLETAVYVQRMPVDPQSE